MPIKFKLSIIAFFATIFFASASMICPPAKHLKCDDDIHNLHLTGKPTLFGSHKLYTPKYTDQSFANACNVGHTIRRWFIDLNNNDICEINEPACYQDIFQTGYNYNNISITFPKDITVACTGDIPKTGPAITGGPCDILGYSFTDQEFLLVGAPEDGCKKILRKFTVINWCTYNPNGPNYGNVWTGTQVIKIVNKTKPEITACKDITIGFNQGCKAQISLSNKAKSEGECASSFLSWFIDVDINADLTIDYKYGNDKSGDFFIPLKENGGEVKINVPGLYGMGIHKVYWKVKDACGNLTTCVTTVVTKDTKAPTPYCPAHISTAVDNHGDVRVGARMFNLGAFDNCTASQFIRTSFSSNPADSLRFYNCQNAGYKDLNVYFHDAAGNSSFCKVALTIYDNDGCQGNISFQGRIVDLQGNGITGGVMKLQANEDLLEMYRDINEGIFKFDATPIYPDAKLTPSKIGIEPSTIDLFDFVIFANYVMGIDTLTPLGHLAGDINEDGRSNARDLELVENFIKNNDFTFGVNSDWKFIASYIDIAKLNLKKYSPTYDTKKFNGKLDFTAIAKGDISASLSLSGNREFNTIYIYQDSKININGENYIPFTADYDVAVKALEIATTAKAKDILLPENFESITRSGKSYVYNFNSTTLDNQPLFYVKASDLTSSLDINGYLINENLERINIKLIDKLEDKSLVYPVPAGNTINVKAYPGTKLEIYNNSGILLMKQVLKEYGEAIDISALQSGLFIVKVGDKVEKVVKN